MTVGDREHSGLTSPKATDASSQSLQASGSRSDATARQAPCTIAVAGV